MAEALPELQDYYEVLGVQKTATRAEIKKAYFQLARENHPDKVPEHLQTDADEIFKEINEAYSVLSDERQRANYDNRSKPVPKAKRANFTKTAPEKKEVVVAEVCGKVTSIGKNGHFTVFAEQSKKKFKCLYQGFLPLREGDTVIGLAQFDPKLLTFLYPPFVIITNEISSSFYICKISSVKTKKTIDILSQKSGGRPEQLLDKISAFLYSDFSDLQEVGDNPYIPFSLVLTEREFAKVTKHCYKDRVLRQLYLLGLTNREIKDSNMDPVSLYDKCIENPYAVISISLEKCDDIFRRCGKPPKAEYKECGTIVRRVSKMMSNGWTGIPLASVVKMFPDISRHLKNLNDHFGVIGEMKTLYLSYPYDVETSVASWIKDLLEKDPINVLSRIYYTRPDLSEDQKVAVNVSLSKNISVITGPGGSGKTHCIKELIYNLDKNGITYCLTSFTGKAVARIREVTGKKQPATLDMMISNNKDKSQKKESFKVLIVDEASMVTTELFYRFLRQFTHDFSVIFIGDVNQLQPIGWGSLFESIIKSNKVPVTRLNTIHRVEGCENNGILINSQKIISYDPNDMPTFEFTKTPNFNVMSGDIALVKNLIEVLTNNAIPANQIVIISPYNRDLEVLNSSCSVLYNGLNRSVNDSRGKLWRIGDRVMYTQNNYKFELTNGSEGMVTDCDPGSLTVKFDNGSYTFETEAHSGEEDVFELHSKDLIHSYACTVHRLQGSEYSYVIGYIPQGNTSFLNKNLLYTMITRTKKMIWLVGDVPTMVQSAMTKPSYRHENLIGRLMQ